MIIPDCSRLSKKRRTKSSFRTLIYLYRAAFLFNMSPVCNNDLICHFNCLILVMRNKNTGDPKFFNHILQPRTKFLSDFCINRCKRLIQQKKLRIWCKSSRKSHSLSLTTGKLTWISFFKSFQSDQFNQFRYSFFNIGFIRFLYFQTKCNIVINCHVTK